MFDRERLTAEALIRAYLAENGIPAPDEFLWVPVPFSGEWGISTSFFAVAAQEARGGKKVVVPQRAAEIAEGARDALGEPEGFARTEAVRGYLNLYFDTAEYSRRVIDAVLEEGEAFGRAPGRGERVMVEYSQPNTHKPIHVGHLRNMILGAAVCNLLEAAGWDVVRANYPGDTGLHVIKWMWNYMRNHPGEQPPEDRIRWLGDLYAEANRLLEEDPELEAEMRALFKRWDAGDPEVMDLWRRTREWSIEGFNQAYDALDIPFDVYYWQSEVEEAGKKVVQELIERGLAVDERPEGSVVVHLDDLLGLEKETYRAIVVLRSDGTSLYATWDLGLAIRKFAEYDLARSIYVVDVRQSLHLQQVFKTLELMGYSWTDKLYHLPYEIVNLPGNVTMASREGTVVLLEDLLREAFERAREIVDEKNPELEAAVKDEVARAVSLGAIKYPMLSRENTRIATFDWKQALDFNGQAALYIQYAAVRANSILSKAGLRRAEELPEGPTIPAHELHASEIELIDLISRVPAEIVRAAEEFKTLHITNSAYEIARAFSDFYNHCPVLSEAADVRDFRLRLVAAARQVLVNLLGILGIEAPEVM
ncbi:MAG TPA: arginine--tRNA ligase [Anaerolineales bacterium]|nr:arginine--tRNA ligase [Anaerolineales bacterium]